MLLDRVAEKYVKFFIYFMNSFIHNILIHLSFVNNSKTSFIELKWLILINLSIVLFSQKKPKNVLTFRDLRMIDIRDIRELGQLVNFVIMSDNPIVYEIGAIGSHHQFHLEIKPYKLILSLITVYWENTSDKLFCSCLSNLESHS